MINFSSSVQVCIAWRMKFLCVWHEFPYVVQLLHEFLVSGELKYNRWLISLIYKKCVLNTRFITTTMLKQQFQRFGILLMWKRGRGACANRNTPLHAHFLLTCLFQDRAVSVHVCDCQGYYLRLYDLFQDRTVSVHVCVW